MSKFSMPVRFSRDQIAAMSQVDKAKAIAAGLNALRVLQTSDKSTLKDSSGHAIDAQNAAKAVRRGLRSLGWYISERGKTPPAIVKAKAKAKAHATNDEASNATNATIDAANAT